MGRTRIRRSLLINRTSGWGGRWERRSMGRSYGRRRKCLALGSGNPVLEPGLERALRRDEAGSDVHVVTFALVIEREVYRHLGAQRLASAHHVFGGGEAAVDVLRG